MLITDALAVDHAKARQAIAQILARPTSAPKLYPGLAKALAAHNDAEEATLYRALRRIPDLRAQIATSTAQHHALDGMLSRLSQTPYDHPIWFTRFAAARRALENHLAVEETAVFDEARTLPLPQQRLLGTRYRALMDMLTAPPRRMNQGTGHAATQQIRGARRDPYQALRRRAAVKGWIG